MATNKSSQINYRKLNDELDKLLAEFDDPNIDVDKALDLYEQADGLIKQIEEYLAKAKNRLTDVDSGKEK